MGLTRMLLVLAAMILGGTAHNADTEMKSRRPITFLGKRSIALFEVKAVKVIEANTDGFTVKKYSLEVEVVDCLPSFPEKKHYAVTLSRTLTAWRTTGPDLLLDKGKLFVASFDGQPAQLEAMRLLLPAAANRSVFVDGLSLDDYDATTMRDVWFQTKTFYATVKEEKNSTASIVTAIKDNKDKLGVPFFSLLSSWHRSLYDDKDIALACLAFLRDRKVPLTERFSSLTTMQGIIRPGPQEDREMALATVGLAIEAKNAKDLQLAKACLTYLAAYYIANQPKDRLAQPSKEASRDINQMLSNKKLFGKDETAAKELREWLESYKD